MVGRKTEHHLFQFLCLLMSQWHNKNYAYVKLINQSTRTQNWQHQLMTKGDHNNTSDKYKISSVD